MYLLILSLLAVLLFTILASKRKQQLKLAKDRIPPPEWNHGICPQSRKPWLPESITETHIHYTDHQGHHLTLPNPEK